MCCRSLLGPPLFFNELSSVAVLSAGQLTWCAFHRAKDCGSTQRKHSNDCSGCEQMQQDVPVFFGTPHLASSSLPGKWNGTACLTVSWWSHRTIGQANDTCTLTHILPQCQSILKLGKLNLVAQTLKLKAQKNKLSLISMSVGAKNTSSAELKVQFT